VAFASLYTLDPTDTNIIHHFIFLSYRQDPAPGTPGPAQYGKGLWDIAFVSFYTIVLTFTREFIMQELLHPLARACGIKSRAKQLRFMEQMYTAIYFGISGPVGLYVMRRTPVWYFNTRGMYEVFPHRTHEAVFKFYYLFEAAYWAQQALVMVLGMEKPRKDYKELVAHHIVTLALIGLSYRFHFTYIGIAVYITHDISDFFLAVCYYFLHSRAYSPNIRSVANFILKVSKSFHYIDFPLVIPFYALNVGTWIYLRHYLNLRILWSLLTEFRTVGPYELNWETQQYKCWISNIITFALLAMLQSLNLFWLYCLLRSAWRFISTGEKKDDRSEDEEEGEGEGGLNGNAKVNGSGNGVAKAH
jgi:acyl-CoA-dependent ceramide synthase